MKKQNKKVKRDYPRRIMGDFANLMSLVEKMENEDDLKHR
jgi:hypothetical protein